jgi:hypothetical protein
MGRSLKLYTNCIENGTQRLVEYLSRLHFKVHREPLKYVNKYYQTFIINLAQYAIINLPRNILWNMCLDVPSWQSQVSTETSLFKCHLLDVTSVSVKICRRIKCAVKCVLLPSHKLLDIVSSILHLFSSVSIFVLQQLNTVSWRFAVVNIIFR